MAVDAMNAPFVLAMLVLLVVVCAAVMVGNMDVSSPALAMQEIKQGTPGAATSTIIFNQIVSVLLGILVTGMIGGVGTLVFKMASEWLEIRKPDWEPGPNARWGQRGGGSKPRGLSQDDMLQLMLMGILAQQQGRNVPQVMPREQGDDTQEF